MYRVAASNWTSAKSRRYSRWTEVWSDIYLGRIYDIQGDRTRAVNQYSKAKQTGDDTGGAQAEAEKSLKKAYSEGAG